MDVSKNDYKRHVCKFSLRPSDGICLVFAMQSRSQLFHESQRLLRVGGHQMLEVFSSQGIDLDVRHRNDRCGAWHAEQ